MDVKICFLWLCTFQFTIGFNASICSMVIFIGTRTHEDNFTLIPQKLGLLYTSTVPQLLYFVHESQLELLDPIKRPYYFKSVNKVNHCIVMDKLESIPSVSESLERTLTPKIQPILYKDEEKVTFYVISWDNQETQLFMRLFGKTLKYKLILSYKSLTELQSPDAFTSCEFCKLKQNLIASKPEWIDYESNFGGTILRITTPTSGRSRLNYTLGPDGKYRMVSGLLMYLIQYMQKKMNFTIDLKVAGRGGGTGIKLPNGTWNGVMSEILDGEVDIGMCTAESYSRSLEAGFTPAVTVEPVLLVSGPPHKIFAWKAIFWPFKSEVWTGLAGIITISILMIKISYIVLKFPQKRRWSSIKVLEFIVGVILENPGKTPSHLPFTIKLYVIVWLLCGSIITAAYLSKLIGFLTFPQLETVPETAEELVESKYRWGITYLGGALYSLIKGSKIKVYEKLLSKVELRKDTIGCLKQTLDTKYMCISYEIISKFYLNSRIDLKENPFTYSKTPFVTIPVGIALEKRAVFGPNLKALVRSSEITGLKLFWDKLDARKVRKSLLQRNKPDHKRESDIKQDGNSNERSLSIQHMSGAFTVLVAGIVIACIAFILEKIMHLTNLGHSWPFIHK